MLKEKLDNLAKEEKKNLAISDLSLCVPVVEIGSIDKNSKGNIRGTSSSDSAVTERKQRRCWSPDLHRRFVNALQQLGGPHGKILVILYFSNKFLVQNNEWIFFCG
ncbi:hypothetical protein POM88_049562 [Heracleum sosnowskyi]|uniref:Uncharacterized protein n=1 Tax=Heracleum sosnowskyi TaxID=360622 RepID=A0AAD8GYM9_9APIA|nr:hypothetical protein POM88_049562 [Heracleum sosnowskyi]